MSGTPTHAKHQTPTTSGTLAHIRINRILHRRHFIRGTDQATIREWLLKTELKYRTRRARRTGRFEDDAAVYLDAIKGMPTYAQRAQHIQDWVAVFSGRQRDSISADEVRAQLHRWRTDTRAVPQRAKPGQTRSKTLILSPAAVNKRRTALAHLFTVLDGKSAPNPVKDVPKFAEPSPPARAIPYTKIRALFTKMPASRTKAILMVIAYTGIPPEDVRRISPQDVDLRRRIVAVHGRRKGSGTAGRLVPLLPEAVAAFKMMAREDAWGTCTNTTLRRSFRRGCKAIGLDPNAYTTYDLRHSFATEMLRRSGDLRATQILLDHSTPQLTIRYALAAGDPRVAKALKSWR